MLVRTKTVDRVLAIALLIAALVGAYAAIVAPAIARIQKSRDDITDQRVLLGRLHSELDRSDANVEAQPDADETRGTYFLQGTSTAVRVANLQARLGTLVADANVAIMSARAVAPETRDGLPFDGVEITFRATDAQLQDLLTAIERDRPLLFVDGLLMTPAPIEADNDQNDNARIDVTLRILGVVEQKAG